MLRPMDARVSCSCVRMGDLSKPTTFSTRTYDGGCCTTQDISGKESCHVISFLTAQENAKQAVATALAHDLTEQTAKLLAGDSGM